MKFKLGAILSVGGERLMCKIDDVYKILNFMTNDNLFTHQLPRVGRECRPYLLRQFPWLKDYIDNFQDKITTENWQEILSECRDKYGDEFEVSAIPMDDHDHKDPLEELEDMVGKEKVIVVDPHDIKDE